MKEYTDIVLEETSNEKYQILEGKKGKLVFDENSFSERQPNMFFTVENTRIDIAVISYVGNLENLSSQELLITDADSYNYVFSKDKYELIDQQ